MTDESRGDGFVLDLDRDVCIGSGECVMAEPQRFSMEDDGAASVNEGGAMGLALSRAQELERLCPSGAIVVTAESAPKGDLT